jgi:DNA-binding Lrp family transcriptional regulator
VVPRRNPFVPETKGFLVKGIESGDQGEEVRRVKAYVLIQTGAGKTASVVEALRGTEGVQFADTITGPYDAIAAVEAADPNAIGKLVTETIHALDGVTRTLTCFALELG